MSAADNVVTVAVVFVLVAGIGYPLWFWIYQWWDLRQRRKAQEDTIMAVLLRSARRSAAAEKSVSDRGPLRMVRTRDNRLGSPNDTQHLTKGPF